MIIKVKAQLMNLITDLVFNQEVYSFNLEGTGHELTNASQYILTNEQYKWKDPFPNSEKERFILLGDGNHVVADREVAFIILLKLGTENNYVVKSDVFKDEFVLA